MPRFLNCSGCSHASQQLRTKCFQCVKGLKNVLAIVLSKHPFCPGKWGQGSGGGVGNKWSCVILLVSLKPQRHSHQPKDLRNATLEAQITDA
ncbi:hypothetical protein TNCV_4577481 [Trichonephila clavipes]|nr:hypothetical protein TNCV_4577481 [Trichonephila clavipes]